MSVQLSESFDGQLVSLQAREILDRADYQHFVPKLERLITKHGKIRLLFDMHEFYGWQAAALWEDIKFDMKHFSDIERVAIIGEKTWEKWMATVCRPLTTATIRYYDKCESAIAHEWMEEGLSASST